MSGEHRADDLLADAAAEGLLALDDEVRTKVLRGNAERVFKFELAEPAATTGTTA